jgi:lipopolysaccharide biosynthesis glycosyltransferase
MAPDIKLFIGWDSREDIAFQVCRQSALRNSARDLPIYALKQNSLRELGLYTRPVDAKASTEFSLTRFLTPYLAGGSGWSIFVDCDFLFTGDVARVMDGVSADKAVYVVQHDYTPAQSIKMDDKQQSIYPRKNWSSFILFNNAHPKVQALTPDVVNGESPAYLHRFSWLEDKDIGALDLTWNFLVGEYPKPKVVPTSIHYTNGGPWFENCQGVDYAAEWIAERDLYLSN